MCEAAPSRSPGRFRPFPIQLTHAPMDVFRVALAGSAFGLIVRGLVEIANAAAQPVGSRRAVVVLLPVVAVRHRVFNASISARSAAALAACADSAPAGTLRPSRPLCRNAAVIG